MPSVQSKRLVDRLEGHICLDVYSVNVVRNDEDLLDTVKLTIDRSDWERIEHTVKTVEWFKIKASNTIRTLTWNLHHGYMELDGYMELGILSAFCYLDQPHTIKVTFLKVGGDADLHHLNVPPQHPQCRNMVISNA